jgi:hypothetical protein
MYHCTYVSCPPLTGLVVGILVRDENARGRLKKEVGDIMFEKLGIVM